MNVWDHEMTGTGVTMVASLNVPIGTAQFVSDLTDGPLIALWRLLAGTQFAEFDSWAVPPSPGDNFPYGYDVAPD
jgi:hypothetical protein